MKQFYPMALKKYLLKILAKGMPVYFCLLAGCYTNKQIVIDETLSGNSEKWKADIRKGFLAIGRTSFGTFNTIACSKLDSPKLKESSYKNFSFYFFRENHSVKKRKVYALSVSGTSDTANVLLSVWFNSETSEPGLFSLYRDSETKNSKDAEGAITISSDTSLWKFSIKDYAVNALTASDMYKMASGYLMNSMDTISISHIGAFTDGRPGFAHVVSKGVALSSKGKHIAALQLVGANYVWIHNDLPANTRLAIAGLFSAILGSKDL
jgi:hypothetical protein